MHVVRSAQFDEESERFALRFACEDCAHFEAAAERCRHEWPIELHRAPRAPLVPLTPSAGPNGPETKETFAFCKEFELC